MKNRLIRFGLLCWLAGALMMSVARAEEVWLKDITVGKLQELYEECGYEGEKGYLMIPSYRYPAIFLDNFPTDYNTITDETVRNALFIKILTPLALRLNEELSKERAEIQKISNDFGQSRKLGRQQIELLEEKAKKYDVFSRLEGDERYSYLLAELLVRVDRIPPSIMVVAAAIETNWGASRIVREANSLYKMLVWHTKDGLKPMGETEDDSYRIKIYPNIYESMKDFALKLNSQPAFAVMRNLRRERRVRTNNMSGLFLAPYTYGSSNLENYAGIFDYTLAYYELLVIDKSKLDSNMVDGKTLKEFEKYVTKM